MEGFNKQQVFFGFCKMPSSNKRYTYLPFFEQEKGRNEKRRAWFSLVFVGFRWFSLVFPPTRLKTKNQVYESFILKFMKVLYFSLYPKMIFKKQTPMPKYSL